MAKHQCYSQGCAIQTTVKNETIPTLGTFILSTSEKPSEAKAPPGHTSLKTPAALTTGLFQNDFQFILHL